MAAGLYAGTTLADDGTPILLLDPSGIAAIAGVPLGYKEIDREASPLAEQGPARKEVPALLFRTRDGVKRVISLAVVERIEDIPADAVKLSAGRMRVALQEKILPLAGCSGGSSGGNLRILRLSDGAAELAYGFGEVIDLITLPEEVKPAAVPGEILGVTLIEGEQVEVIDPFWLFASHAPPAQGQGSRLVCAIPAGDPWMHNILKPIIESAGYRVVTAGETDAPDIVIERSEASTTEIGAAAEIIRIRAKPERTSEQDNSIYRYDRAALLAALGRGVQRRG
jgi:two-component system chemotaxis sensor kinase CheA